MERPDPHHVDETPPPSPRARLRRHADRGRYDTETVHAIIDEALVCHVAVVVEGEAIALPTAHARIDARVYLHGAVANRTLRTARTEGRATLTFTLLDGLIFARTAFHHSMNFRSAVVFGPAEEVRDPDEKRRALTALVEHTAPGRSREVTPPTDAELTATSVIAVRIEEASAKVRTGPPVDSPEDIERSEAWAGELPLRTVAAPPVRDPLLPPARSTDASVAARAEALGAEPPIERWHDGHLLSTDRNRVDLALVHRFLSEESYWAAGVSLDSTRTVVDRSLCFGLYRDGAQIGFARAVTDGARFAYLADVFVLAPHRGAGLGQALIRFALAHPDVARADRVLLGTQDAHGLYAKLGFHRAPGGRYMVRLPTAPAPRATEGAA